MTVAPAVVLSAPKVELSVVSAPSMVEKAGKGGLAVACTRLGTGHRTGPGAGVQYPGGKPAELDPP